MVVKMKKTYDTTLIFAITLLILFAVFLIIFVFQNTHEKNLDNNVNNDIYEEHSHYIVEIPDSPRLQKTYQDIATYTTKIYDKDNNRVYNIKKAAKKLDGHIVKSGEEFSFNSTMGEMGQADGYKKAIGFDSNGKKIKMYGGGICQISSTLYNAVLICNLEVTERHPHSRRVYYVPKNKDATVFSGGPDFRFKNTTDSNIMICTTTNGYTVTVTLKQEKIIEI